MSSKTRWPQDCLMNPLIHAHNMIHGRRLLNAYDAFHIDFGMDEEADCSDSSDDWDRSSGHEYCGLSRNFLQRPSARVTGVTRTRPVTCEDIKKAEKSAEELIEEEERLKKKAEKKRLKKLRQKEKKRLEKQEKENANKANDTQNKGEDIKKKNLNKKSAESPPYAGPGCNSDASTEEEDDKGSTSSEKEHPIKKKLQEKKNYNRTNVGEQTLSNNETVSKAKNPNKSHADKDQEYSDSSSDEGEEEEGKQSDLEELDMSSCFVSNAKAAIAKRQLEKAKEKKEKKDKKSVDSGTESPKPCTEQQNSKAPQREVTPLSTENPAKMELEKNPTDLIARSIELAVIGNQYAAKGNLEMAVKYFTDAIMHNPREYKLFGNRSFCFEKMQQYEKSLRDANTSLSMKPQWIKGLYRKGRALTGLKRYVEATHVYKEVLTLDKSCTDAAQELMKVQILQLMEMGFTKEQSANAMIIYGSVEKALDALSGLQGTYISVKPRTQEDWVRVEKRSQSPKPVSEVGPTVQPPVPLIQPQPSPSAPAQSKPVKPELFPVWVGCPAQTLTEAFIYDLFNSIGPVHSVKVLRNKGCAFVNYIRKEDSEKAIKRLHGYIVAAGIPLQVRFPDRIHPHLGMSKTAVTERSDKLPDECYFWRTSGCVKNQNCQYRHIPENKGIDRNKVK